MGALTDQDQTFMQRALELARAGCRWRSAGWRCHRPPGEIIAEGSKLRIGTCDPTAHAEMIPARGR
jgi:tRNA(Arg) A34 adenosine deaminase TadA